MDPSALIFIALAVAWAAYLIPKALEHHEESARSRGIATFSDRLRILARREPTSRRRSALVTVADTPEPPPPAPAPVVLTPAQWRVRRLAARAAARRRRRVLDLLLLANVGVALAAILGHLTWPWQGVPAGLVLLWLAACRRSVRRERRRTAELLSARATAATAAATSAPRVDLGWGLGWEDDVTGEIARIVESPVPDEEVDQWPSTTQTGAAPVPGWEMLPFVVPTYVAKEQVRRAVRTIDLDSTGVWSSGRNAADSALVREAGTPAAEVDEGPVAASGS